MESIHGLDPHQPIRHTAAMPHSARSKLASPRRAVASLVLALIATLVLTFIPASCMELGTYRPDEIEERDPASARLPGYLPDSFRGPTAVSRRHPYGLLDAPDTHVGDGFGVTIDSIHGELEIDPPMLLVIERYSFGWPFRTVYFDMVLGNAVDAGDGPTRSGREIMQVLQQIHADAGHHAGREWPDWLPTPDRGSFRMLPTAVLPAGLLANIAIAGTAAYALFSLPAAARRLGRAIRRDCPSCGYRWSGLTACPECGHARRVRGAGADRRRVRSDAAPRT